MSSIVNALLAICAAQYGSVYALTRQNAEYSGEKVKSSLGGVTVEPRNSPKIGRNELCPCGSGKKHKKCCIKKSTYHIDVLPNDHKEDGDCKKR